MGAEREKGEEAGSVGCEVERFGHCGGGESGNGMQKVQAAERRQDMKGALWMPCGGGHQARGEAEGHPS